MKASVYQGLWMILDGAGCICGAGGRTRTDTEFPQLDFESSASTNFATPAARERILTEFSGFEQYLM